MDPAIIASLLSITGILSYKLFALRSEFNQIDISVDKLVLDIKFVHRYFQRFKTEFTAASQQYNPYSPDTSPSNFDPSFWEDIRLLERIFHEVFEDLEKANADLNGYSRVHRSKQQIRLLNGGLVNLKDTMSRLRDYVNMMGTYGRPQYNSVQSSPSQFGITEAGYERVGNSYGNFGGSVNMSTANLPAFATGQVPVVVQSQNSTSSGSSNDRSRKQKSRMNDPDYWHEWDGDTDPVSPYLQQDHHHSPVPVVLPSPPLPTPPFSPAPSYRTEDPRSGVTPYRRDKFVLVPARTIPEDSSQSSIRSSITSTKKKKEKIDYDEWPGWDGTDMAELPGDTPGRAYNQKEKVYGGAAGYGRYENADNPHENASELPGDIPSSSRSRLEWYRGSGRMYE